MSEVHRTGFPAYLEPQEYPPPSATVQVTFGACSRRGPSHIVNEDHYLVFRLGRSQDTLLTSVPELMADRFEEFGYAMVVADGMGRPGAGESASHLALATLVYLVRHSGKWNLRINTQIAQEIMQRAERFYRHVDRTIVHQRQVEGSRIGQTTLTATFGAGRDLFFAHVGHSRAYIFRSGHLMRLTRDHTVGRRQSTAPLGPIVDVNFASQDLRHILTDTVGMKGSVGPMIDLERIHLEDDDRVMVCSNGLTDAVDEAEIAKVLANDKSPDLQTQALADLAEAAGTTDDVTALVARYRIPPAADTTAR